MSYPRFSNWIVSEGKDIFGFESDRIEPKKQQEDDDPVNPIESELVIDELSRITIGNKLPFRNWSDEIEWGKGMPASVKVDLSPLGSYKLFIRRKVAAISGESVWICKKILPLNELNDKANKNEVGLASDIATMVNEIDSQMPEGPNSQFEKFENLVLNIASDIRSEAPKIFIYEGIKKHSDNHYTVYMSYDGHGVESPGQYRVEQFNVELFYDKKRGLIRSWGCEVSSPMRQHLWQLMPSEWDEYFSPDQSQEEIREAILNALRSY